MYETINSPVNYGGLTLKNRIIFAPTTFGLKDEDLFDEIQAIAKGDCAMIIIGDVPAGKSVFEKSLFNRKGFAYYQKLTEIAHQYDCKICAQLHQSDSNIKAMLKYIPKILMKKMDADQLRQSLNEEVGPYITNMSKDKIHQIIHQFTIAAKRAKEAGFDMIQVHGDRMCGSFSSSIFNHRTDEYGGCAENRARFAQEIVSGIRKQFPDMPIDYKLAVRQESPHYGNAGVLVEELKTFVPILEKAGVTSFHVALANHSRLEDTIPSATHAYFNSQGCFLKYCDVVRRYTDLPLTCVGGLHDPAFIEAQLSSNRITCAAMSRQLLADPEWCHKVEQNKTETIHHCIRCNQCLHKLMNHQGTHCIYEEKRK